MESKPSKKAAIFTGFTDGELALLHGISEFKVYDEGDIIFSLGEEVRRLIVVAYGTVALTLPIQIKGTSNNVTIEEKGAGAVLAWSALVPPHKFTLGARALTAVGLYEFDRDALARLFGEQPRLHLMIANNLNRVIASRVTLLEALVARDLQRWVSEKYA
ncbi:MAG: cyclic nucleotide-binding domain-containing protein [Deltaproteobacteria bacterium]|nr:cyclic nucleotide-binding domain-containing protein [Deltaproteobacteria bacterium]